MQHLGLLDLQRIFTWRARAALRSSLLYSRVLAASTYQSANWFQNTSYATRPAWMKSRRSCAAVHSSTACDMCRCIVHSFVTSGFWRHSHVAECRTLGLLVSIGQFGTSLMFKTL